MPIRVIALICSAVGLGIPYWAEYEHRFTGLKFNYGIYQVCSDIIGCEYTGTLNESTHEERDLRLVRVLFIILNALAQLSIGARSPALCQASFSSLYCVSEQRRLWRDCMDAQARLSLHCSPM